MDNQNAGQGKSNKKLMAIIAYIIFFVPLLTDLKNDPFVKFHVKQGLVLTLANIIVWVGGSMIPVLGWMLIPIFNLVILVLFIIGILNAAMGKQKYLPIIGKFADNFNF